MCLALAGGCAAQTDAADKSASVSNDIAAAAVLFILCRKRRF